MITNAKRLGALLSACLLLWSASISALADEAGIVRQALRAETANIAFSVGVVEPQAKGFLQTLRNLVQGLIIVDLTDKVVKIILIDGSDLFEHYHRWETQTVALTEIDVRRKIGFLYRSRNSCHNRGGTVFVEIVRLDYEDRTVAVLD